MQALLSEALKALILLHKTTLSSKHHQHQQCCNQVLYLLQTIPQQWFPIYHLSNELPLHQQGHQYAVYNQEAIRQTQPTILPQYQLQWRLLHRSHHKEL